MQITQLVLGVLSIVFGIAILAYAVKYQYYYDWEYFYSDSYAFISTGIWAGIFVSSSMLVKKQAKVHGYG